MLLALDRSAPAGPPPGPAAVIVLDGTVILELAAVGVSLLELVSAGVPVLELAAATIITLSEGT